MWEWLETGHTPSTILLTTLFPVVQHLFIHAFVHFLTISFIYDLFSSFIDCARLQLQKMCKQLQSNSKKEILNKKCESENQTSHFTLSTVAKMKDVMLVAGE